MRKLELPHEAYRAWLEDGSTRAVAIQARQNEGIALRALLAAARNTTDPAIAGKLQEYEDARDLADFLNGGKRAGRDD